MSLLLRFLRTYALPYWRWYLLGLAGLYGTARLTVLIPELTRLTLDALGTSRGQAPIGYLLALVATSLGLIGVRAVGRLSFFNTGRAAEYRLKSHLFRHLMHLPQSFHDQTSQGDLMSRAANDMQNVRALIGFAGLQLVEAVILIPLTVAQMLALEARLTGISLGMLSLAVAALYFSATTASRIMRRSLEQLSSLSAHILSTWSAIPVVQGFCAEDAFDARFARLNDKYIMNGLRFAGIRSVLIPLVTLMGSLAVGVVLLEGGQEVLSGRLTVGTLVAWSGYVGILTARLMGFGWMLSVVQRGMISLRRIYELLDTPDGLPTASQPFPAPVFSPVTGQRGYRLEARHLSFTYPGDHGRPAVLRDLSFTLEPGQTLGIFGPTGSGKTTLMLLMARVYTPPPGTLFLNGVDVTALPLEDLRRVTSLVPQDPFLFSVSIRQNILWGDEDEDPARLTQAVQRACLETDLQALNQGLETMVGARGITLSGGQRQRVALARAFYRAWHILLLDDVLAAVDHVTERKLIDNMYALTHTAVPQPDGEGTGTFEEGVGRPGEGAGSSRREGTPLAQTTAIISHRLSALAHADLILVLEDGAVVDQGTHASLISRPGRYADTWRMQLEADAEADAEAYGTLDAQQAGGAA